MAGVGTPMIGEVLADRYRLEQHVNDDSTGRQVWRGLDVVLRRPVTVVLRTPGGSAADEMLTAAVAASRVVHPNIVGVYDAIDEHDRAYVVREWVDGRALREAVREAPLDPDHAGSVALAVADALSAVHEAGVTHGNVHPGTVMLSHDGRVILADARATAHASPATDVRAVGAVLYCALTGHWPHEIHGPAGLPDAPRLPDGRLASPRQVRGGVPDYLDALTMDLLDPRLPPPSAAELTGELRRAHIVEPAAGGLDFIAEDIGEAPETSRPMWQKAAVAVAGLLVVTLLAVLLISRFSDDGGGAGARPPQGGGPVAGQARPLELKADQVRVVDTKRSPDEVKDAELAIDGNPETAWTTTGYKSAGFGSDKPGMGLLINFGKETDIASVQVQLTFAGPEVSLRTGTSDPGATAAGDTQIAAQYETRAGPVQVDTDLFRQPLTELKTQYLLIWISKLPKATNEEFPFQIGIKEVQITVR